MRSNRNLGNLSTKQTYLYGFHSLQKAFDSAEIPAIFYLKILPLGIVLRGAINFAHTNLLHVGSGTVSGGTARESSDLGSGGKALPRST